MHSHIYVGMPIPAYQSFATCKKSSGKLVCPELVEFVGAVGEAGVGEELKIAILRGGIDDFNTAWDLPEGRSQ